MSLRAPHWNKKKRRITKKPVNMAFDRALLKQAKAKAEETGTTFSGLVDKSLRLFLASYEDSQSLEISTHDQVNKEGGIQ